MSKRRWVEVAAFCLFNVAISAAYAAPPFNPVRPAPVQVPGPIVDNGDDTDGKGTIGLVCIDDDGNQVTWRDNMSNQTSGALEVCMQRVMQKWQTQFNQHQVDVQDLNFNERIEGYRSYELMVEGLRWSQQIRRLPLPRRR